MPRAVSSSCCAGFAAASSRCQIHQEVPREVTASGQSGCRDVRDSVGRGLMNCLRLPRSHSHPFKADLTHPGRKSLAVSLSPLATPSPRLWFLGPSRSLVTGPDAAPGRCRRLPSVRRGRCRLRPPFPSGGSRPCHPCRHPFLTQRAGSPPRSVTRRGQAPVATRLHGVSPPGTGGTRVTRSVGRGLSCASGPDVWSPVHCLPL